jgi:hypothetical protein
MGTQRLSPIVRLAGAVALAGALGCGGAPDGGSAVDPAGTKEDNQANDPKVATTLKFTCRQSEDRPTLSGTGSFKVWIPSSVVACGQRTLATPSRR